MANEIFKTLKPNRSVITDKNIKNYFLVFLFLGGLAVVIASAKTDSVLTAIIFPLIVMVLYIVFIEIKGRGVIANDQIGDSVYYLGFLLTLIALILTLFYAADNTRDSLDNILPKFGIALITTIFGLGYRVYKTAFDVTIEDVKDLTETNLSEAAINFKTRLTIANESFRDSVSSFPEQIRTLLEGQSNQLSIFLKENTEEFAKSSIKIIDNINEASNKLTHQANQLDSSLTILNESIMSFKDSLLTINNEVENISSSFKNLDQINISEQLINLNNNITSFNNTFEEHKHRMSKLHTIIEEDVSFLEKHKSQLQSALEQSQNSIIQIQDNLISLTKVVVEKLKR